MELILQRSSIRAKTQPASRLFQAFQAVSYHLFTSFNISSSIATTARGLHIWLPVPACLSVFMPISRYCLVTTGKYWALKPRSSSFEQQWKPLKNVASIQLFSKIC